MAFAEVPYLFLGPRTAGLGDLLQARGGSLEGEVTEKQKDSQRPQQMTNER